MFSITSNSPRCMTRDVSILADGTGVCHCEGLLWVHGNTDPLEPFRFDLERCRVTNKCERVGQPAVSCDLFSRSTAHIVCTFVQVKSGFDDTGQVRVDHVLRYWRCVRVTSRFLWTFTKYIVLKLDPGPDHAWVDVTGLHVWILFFRFGGVGVIVWMEGTHGSTTGCEYLIPFPETLRLLSVCTSVYFGRIGISLRDRGPITTAAVYVDRWSLVSVGRGYTTARPSPIRRSTCRSSAGLCLLGRIRIRPYIGEYIFSFPHDGFTELRRSL